MSGMTADSRERAAEKIARLACGELFVTGDSGDLARVAGRLLDDPARRAELSFAALDAVADYDWGTVARNVLSVYETVVLGRTTVSIAQ